MDRPTSPMTAERWMQLKQIFEAAQGKPPADRLRWSARWPKGMRN